MFAADRFKSRWIREWIIFAVCLGLGGHIALALLLHAPEQWPAGNLWLYGLLLALSVYVCIQLLRSVWWLWRGERASDSQEQA